MKLGCGLEAGRLVWVASQSERRETGMVHVVWMSMRVWAQLAESVAGCALRRSTLWNERANHVVPPTHDALPLPMMSCESARRAATR
eukprot:6208550-Pleurochrysis_carterae.AAC.2